MVLIRRGQVNKVALTLSEQTTIVGAFYLFQFTYDQTMREKYFIAPEMSLNPLRVNEFEIEETQSEDLVHGKISMEYTGFGKYTIREQASGTNLDPANSGSIVEIGKFKVVDDEAIVPAFDDVLTETPAFNG